MKRFIRTRGRVLLPYLVLFLASAFPYIHTLKGPFIWDDDFLITDNAAIRDLNRTFHLFSIRYWSTEHTGTPGQYRPIRTLTFALSYRLWGLNPLGYRLTNLALYILVTWLVYALGRRVLRDRTGALVAGLLFAVHPAHTEAVAWIKNRSEILACLFVFVSFWGHLKGEERRRWGFVLSWFTFPLALLSKEVAVVLPLLLALWVVYTFPSHQWLRNAIPLIPHFLLLGIYLGFLFGVLGKHVPPSQGPELTWKGHVTAVLWSIWIYALDLFYPLYLNAEHLLPKEIGFSHPVVWASLILIVVVGCAMFGGLRQKRPWVYGLAWAAVSLLPVINIHYITGRPLADQRVFLASVGVCWFLGGVISTLSRLPIPGLSPTQVRLGVVTGLLLLLTSAGVYAFQRNRVWIDPIALYEDTVRKSPEAERAYYNLGNTYKARGEWEKAVLAYQRAIEINPGYEGSHNNLGLVYYSQGKYDKAEEEYLKALRIQPNAVAPRMNLGVLYKTLGRLHLAEEQFKKLVDLNPSLPEAYLHLGDIYAMRGQWEEAEKAFGIAIEIAPRNAPAFMQLAQLHLRLKRWKKALMAVDRLLEMDERDADAWLLRAELLIQMGDLQEARVALEKVRSMKPHDPQVEVQWGLWKEKQGDIKGARMHYEEALKQTPRDPVANLKLGEILYGEGKVAEAEKYFLSALRAQPDLLQAHLQLARIYLDTPGSRKKAASHLKAAFRLSSNPDVRRRIQRILEVLEEGTEEVSR